MNMKKPANTPAAPAKPENLPYMKIRSGLVVATIWKNTTVIDGEEKEFFNTDLKRSYKDSEGNFKDTTQFGVADLPKAICALQEAYRTLALKIETND